MRPATYPRRAYSSTITARCTKSASVERLYSRQGETPRRLRSQSFSQITATVSTIMSPQIMELSGIGDKAVLEPLDIAVKLHLPGIGNNVQDHVSHLACIWGECTTMLLPSMSLRGAALRDASQLWNHHHGHSARPGRAPPCHFNLVRICFAQFVHGRRHSSLSHCSARRLTRVSR